MGKKCEQVYEPEAAVRGEGEGMEVGGGDPEGKVPRWGRNREMETDSKRW